MFGDFWILNVWIFGFSERKSAPDLDTKPRRRQPKYKYDPRRPDRITKHGFSNFRHVRNLLFQSLSVMYRGCFALLQPQRLLRLCACGSVAAETKHSFSKFILYMFGICYFKAFLCCICTWELDFSGVQ